MSALQDLADHCIVCGAGAVGTQVVAELVAAKRALCVIDRAEERLRAIRERAHGAELHCVLGDASDESALIAAGVARAASVVAALGDDKANLFLTVTARSLSASARIVAEVVEPASRAKLLRAGASAVVVPTQIGGRRLAAEAIKPAAIEFLELMLRDTRKALRIEEVTIPASSGLVGRSLEDVDALARGRVLVLAVRSPEGRFEHDPTSARRLEAGSTIIFLAETGDAKHLRDGVAGVALP